MSQLEFLQQLEAKFISKGWVDEFDELVIKPSNVTPPNTTRTDYVNGVCKANYDSWLAWDKWIDEKEKKVRKVLKIIPNKNQNE